MHDGEWHAGGRSHLGVNPATPFPTTLETRLRELFLSNDAVGSRLQAKIS